MRILFDLWCALLAVVVALTFGGLVLLFLGESPAHIYGLLLQGALGSKAQIAGTLVATTPYLLCGLSLAVAFQAGLFNIGAEGQLFAGAMAGAFVGPWMTSPYFGTLGVLGASVLAGMFLAWIPAWLKNRFGVHEVINTIMLNYIVFSFCAYLLRQPSIRANPSSPRTHDVAVAAQLQGFQWGGWSIDVGCVVGVLLACLLVHIFRRTRWGYEVRVTGLQPEAARNAGISKHRIWLGAFLLSGAIAGLAGGFHVVASAHPHFEMGFSPGWGFWGIALALLARNHPLGVVLAALLFGIFETGSSVLDTSRGIPRELIQILEAFLILMVSSRLFVRLLDPEGRWSHA